MSEVEQLSVVAYRNFVDTCRTLATRQVYVKALRYFMDYLHLSPEAYDRLLDQDPKTTQMNICDYVSFLRKQKSPATVSSYVAAIRKFYSMNDIQLNWDKIHSFEGEKEKQAEDRHYTHGSSLGQCPVGYERDASGVCAPITRPPPDTTESRSEQNIICSGFSYTCG